VSDEARSLLDRIDDLIDRKLARPEMLERLMELRRRLEDFERTGRFHSG
jgi:hypothetical protein